MCTYIFAYLDGPGPFCNRGSHPDCPQLEHQVVAGFRGLQIHWRSRERPCYGSSAVIHQDVLLCSPEFVPQMVGGELAPGLSAEKESVRHCPALATDTSGESMTDKPLTTPDLATRLATDPVWVLGPVMTKVEKSSRSWI